MTRVLLVPMSIEAFFHPHHNTWKQFSQEKNLKLAGFKLKNGLVKLETGIGLRGAGYLRDLAAEVGPWSPKPCCS
jgi:hypothetical protein